MVSIQITTQITDIKMKVGETPPLSLPFQPSGSGHPEFAYEQTVNKFINKNERKKFKKIFPKPLTNCFFCGIINTERKKEV